MKRVFILGLMGLCLMVTEVMAKGSSEGKTAADEPAVTSEQDTNWETREPGVWVEDGVIYARGSAKMATMNFSIDTAKNRARLSIANALINNEISGYASLPEDTQEPSPFSVDGVSGTLGDIQLLDMDSVDGTVTLLISCAGAELTQ